jgi:hypothetical protein
MMTIKITKVNGMLDLLWHKKKKKNDDDLSCLCRRFIFSLYDLKICLYRNFGGQNNVYRRIGSNGLYARRDGLKADRQAADTEQK